MAKRSSAQDTYGNGPSKKKKTAHFSADFEPAYLVDLTKPGNPESLILEPKKVIPMVDLSAERAPERFVTVPEITVDFVDLTGSSPEPEERPRQDKDPKSTRASSSFPHQKIDVHSKKPSCSVPSRSLLFGGLPSGSQTGSQTRPPSPVPPPRQPPPQPPPQPSLPPPAPDKNGRAINVPRPKKWGAKPVPKAASQSPSKLHRHGLTVAAWEKLEDTSTRTLPRFLFRGFHPHSGGGFDPRLNSAGGITPHGFLDPGKKPTTMYDIPRLKHMINGHLSGLHVATQFSSWAANLFFARSFAGDRADAHIAILDTRRAEEHIRAYHVPSLREAKLTKAIVPQEYLVYGPVRGKAFHCVPWKKMSEAIHGLSKLKQTSRGPVILSYEQLRKHVELAKATAVLFRPRHDTRSDIIIAVTVILCCVYSVPGSLLSMDKVLLDAIMSGLSDELKSLQLPGKGYEQFGLFNPQTCKNGEPVSQMYRIFNALDERVRSKRMQSGKANITPSTRLPEFRSPPEFDPLLHPNTY